MSLSFSNAEFEMAAGYFEQIPKSDSDEIVFSGKSNIGKSSLINKLLNRKYLARTSSKPGKTVTINFYALDGFKFVDLPGYGYAKVSFSEKKRWKSLVEGYFNDSRKIKLVIQILDIRHKPTNEDLDMIKYLYYYDYPFIIVLTKSDKLKKNEKIKNLDRFNNQFKDFKNIKILSISSHNSEGIEDLKDAINYYMSL